MNTKSIYITLLLCILSLSVQAEADAQCISLPQDRPACPQACQFNCSSLYTGYLAGICQQGIDLCLQEFAIAYNHTDRCNNDCMSYCWDQRPLNATEVNDCFNANCPQQRDSDCKSQCNKNILPSTADVATCQAKVNATILNAVAQNVSTCTTACLKPATNACKYGSACPYLSNGAVVSSADRTACINNCVSAIDTTPCSSGCQSNATAYYQAMYQGEYDHCSVGRSPTSSEFATCNASCVANYDFTSCRRGCETKYVTDDGYRQQCRKDCRQADFQFYTDRCDRFTKLATDYVNNATQKATQKASTA